MKASLKPSASNTCLSLSLISPCPNLGGAGMPNKRIMLSLRITSIGGIQGRATAIQRLFSNRRLHNRHTSAKKNMLSSPTIIDACSCQNLRQEHTSFNPAGHYSFASRFNRYGKSSSSSTARKVSASLVGYRFSSSSQLSFGSTRKSWVSDI